MQQQPQQPPLLPDYRGGWEGLASFLFGPDWFSIPLEGETADATAAAAADASGKDETKTAAATKDDDGDQIMSNGTTDASSAAASAMKKKPGGKAFLPKRPTEDDSEANNNGSTAISKASPRTSGKGKNLSNMTPGNNKERTVSFSLERQTSGAGGDATTTDPALPNGNNIVGGSAPGDPASTASTAAIRWDAPYPKAVPSFPLVTTTEDLIANNNPNRLPTSLSLHDLATEMEACRDNHPPHSASKRPRKGDGDKAESVSANAERLRDAAMRMSLRLPDDVYYSRGTIWGSIQNEDGNEKQPADSKKAAAGGDSKASAAGSKVKFDPSVKAPSITTTGGVSSAEQVSRPEYVPNFLPPFPTDEYSELIKSSLKANVASSVVMDGVMSRVHKKRKVASSSKSEKEEESTNAAVSERDAVRRSVISLGKSAVGSSYWGSMSLGVVGEATANDGQKTTHVSTSKYLSDVAVPPAQSGGVASGGNSPRPPASAAAKKSVSDATQVVRMERASMERVRDFSFVLEPVVKVIETYTTLLLLFPAIQNIGRQYELNLQKKLPVETPWPPINQQHHNQR